MSQSLRRLLLAGFMLVALLAAGCGPIKSTIMIRDAETAVEQASADQADQKVASVYYYWAAYEYLVKAKITHGHAEFFKSEELAARALELAQKATEKAKGATLRVVEPDLTKKPAGVASPTASAQPAAPATDANKGE
jgi:hypothetical protein